MIFAKLFILGIERELVWTNVDYIRENGKNGKPNTLPLGGLIDVSFISQADDYLLLSWMTNNQDQEDEDRIEEGKICFYNDGFDNPPTRTYTFADAFLVRYKETFHANGDKPMIVDLRISPAIQNYMHEYIKLWNISWLPKEEEIYEPEEIKEPRFIDYYITDLEGNIITQYVSDETIILNIITKNRIGERCSISLADKSHDFKYNNNLLKNDLLEGVVINSDHQKIKLEIIDQQENV